MEKIGFIGFGEVAESFISGFEVESDVLTFAYDIDYKKCLESASKYKRVNAVKTISEVLGETKIVFVAVPCSADASCFEEILKCDNERCIFCDLSTALPEVKKHIANKCKAKGWKYLDVAVMGSVPQLKHKTPLMISGDYEEELLQRLNEIGMDITIVGEEVGRASTVKLCRSVFMKGLAALFIETDKLCDKYSVFNEVYDSIDKNLRNQSVYIYHDRLVEAAVKHRQRQLEEVKECIELQQNNCIKNPMTIATMNIYEELIKEN